MDPKEHISNHFTWKEAIWLNQWGRMATPEDGMDDQVVSNLKHLFQKMDLIRDFLGQPIHITCAYRPEKYNALPAIGGAPGSAHVALGKNVAAADFQVKGMTPDEVRAKILAHLEGWGLRCENKPGSSWVHVDTKPVPPGGTRFFKP